MLAVIKKFPKKKYFHVIRTVAFPPFCFYYINQTTNRTKKAPKHLQKLTKVVSLIKLLQFGFPVASYFFFYFVVRSRFSRLGQRERRISRLFLTILQQNHPMPSQNPVICKYYDKLIDVLVVLVKVGAVGKWKSTCLALFARTITV